MTEYFRPIPRFEVARPEGAPTLAGGWTWFDQVELLTRGAPPRILPASDLPETVRDRLTLPRHAVAGVAMNRPRVMGILNVTPDSFSDGGDHAGRDAALDRARVMSAEVDFVDIGGESTRPGAQDVAIDEEIARTVPVIEAMEREAIRTPVSIDTRKAAVAQVALAAGARMVNDVSGLGFDPAMAPLVAEAGLPLCLMHSIATPATMQNDPVYDDVLLDVYDMLEDRIGMAENAGIARNRIVVDPGIGFGKTLEHNLKLLARLSLFHALGCPILLGASRKRFIGTLGGAADARKRAPGSLAVALAAVAQGVQILRVHDTEATVQALRLFRAVNTGTTPAEAR